MRVSICKEGCIQISKPKFYSETLQMDIYHICMQENNPEIIKEVFLVCLRLFEKQYFNS